MKVVIIGANGQLGMDLMAAYRDLSPVGLTHEEIEIANADSVRKVLMPLSPDLVINTAAYHKVDDCEKNPLRAFEVNAVGAMNLAKVSEEAKFVLVHISTDYVFDGAKRAPYVEADLPHPLSVYAASKLAGEHAVAAYASRGIVVRSSGLYGHNKCRAKGGKNFIDTMLGLARDGKKIRVVNDEVLTPTYTVDLARQVRELAASGACGLYHATNNGACSWYEFAREIFRNAGLAPDLEAVSAAEFYSPVKRPAYSVLDNAGLQKLGIDRMPVWRDSLNAYFQQKQ